jgi:hypothetical protein
LYISTRQRDASANSLLFVCGLSLTSSLDTRNSTNNSQQRHICLLASRWTIRPRKRWLLQLHGLMDYSESTLIVLFAIRPRVQYLINPPRYLYHKTTLKHPSLRCDIFPEATAMLTRFTEARLLIPTDLIVETHDGGHLISGLVDCAAILDFVSEDIVRHFS